MTPKSQSFLKDLLPNPPAAPAVYMDSLPQEYRAKLLRLPATAEVPVICEIKQVIEYYSR